METIREATTQYARVMIRLVLDIMLHTGEGPTATCGPDGWSARWDHPINGEMEVGQDDDCNGRQVYFTIYGIRANLPYDEVVSEFLYHC